MSTENVLIETGMLYAVDLSNFYFLSPTDDLLFSLGCLRNEDVFSSLCGKFLFSQNTDESLCAA